MTGRARCARILAVDLELINRNLLSAVGVTAGNLDVAGQVARDVDLQFGIRPAELAVADSFPVCRRRPTSAQCRSRSAADSSARRSC